jgi:hypothetical protein
MLMTFKQKQKGLWGTMKARQCSNTPEARLQSGAMKQSMFSHWVALGAPWKFLEGTHFLHVNSIQSPSSSFELQIIISLVQMLQCPRLYLLDRRVWAMYLILSPILIHPSALPPLTLYLPWQTENRPKLALNTIESQQLAGSDPAVSKSEICYMQDHLKRCVINCNSASVWVCRRHVQWLCMQERSSYGNETQIKKAKYCKNKLFY